MIDPIKQFGVESNEPEQLELPLTPDKPVEDLPDDDLTGDDEDEDEDELDDEDDTSFDDDETPKDDDE